MTDSRPSGRLSRVSTCGIGGGRPVCARPAVFGDIGDIGDTGDIEPLLRRTLGGVGRRRTESAHVPYFGL